MPGRVGMYVGLTGARLKAADCVYTRVATHRIRAADVQAFTQRLQALFDICRTSIDSLLAEYTASVPREGIYFTCEYMCLPK